MQTINEIAKEYLRKNGITHSFFANYVGISCARCTIWLNGEVKLNASQMQKVHDFLNGKHIVTVDKIVDGE